MISTTLESIHTRSIASILKEKQLNRFFSCFEIEYCRRYRDMNVRLAGCLAAKLAFIKVASQVSGIFDVRKIEIRHTSTGKPYVLLGQKKLQCCCLSISHTGSLAVAFCGIKNGKIPSPRKKKRFS